MSLLKAANNYVANHYQPNRKFCWNSLKQWRIPVLQMACSCYPLLHGNASIRAKRIAFPYHFFILLTWVRLIVPDLVCWFSNYYKPSLKSPSWNVGFCGNFLQKRMRSLLILIFQDQNHRWRYKDIFSIELRFLL